MRQLSGQCVNAVASYSLLLRRVNQWRSVFEDIGKARRHGRFSAQSKASDLQQIRGPVGDCAERLRKLRSHFSISCSRKSNLEREWSKTQARKRLEIALSKTYHESLTELKSTKEGFSITSWKKLKLLMLAIKISFIKKQHSCFLDPTFRKEQAFIKGFLQEYPFFVCENKLVDTVIQISIKIYYQYLKKIRPVYFKEKSGVAEFRIPVSDNCRQIRDVQGEIYQVENAFLGKGAYGTVVLAQSLATGEMLADKITKNVRSNTRLSGVQNEENALRQVSALEPKPLICLKRCGETHQFMKYIEGEMGDCYIEKLQIPKQKGVQADDSMNLLSKLASLGQQLFTQIGYVHSRGFAHTDVAAKNIKINKDGKVTLLDFGGATRLLALKKQDIYDVSMMLVKGCFGSSELKRLIKGSNANIILPYTSDGKVHRNMSIRYQNGLFVLDGNPVGQIMGTTIQEVLILGLSGQCTAEQMANLPFFKV